MNTMLDALKLAGVETSAKEVTTFDEFKDAMFPYFIDTSFLSEITNDELKDANYIESTRTPLTDDDIKEIKVLDKNDLLYKWVLRNKDKCSRLHKPDSNYVLTDSAKRYGTHKNFDSRDYREVLNYGFCCLGYYIYYSKESRSISVECSHHIHSMIERCYLKDESTRQHAKSSVVYDLADWFHCRNSQEEIDTLNILVDIGTFVPIYIDSKYSVHMNRYFPSSYYNTRYSCLGANILEDSNCMEELEDWIVQGGRINPRVYYFVNQSKDGYWYLKRDTIKSPRIQRGDS